MIVTGYKLQHTLRELGHRRDSAAKQFANSWFAFEGDEPSNPIDLMGIFLECEVKIAKLQTAQQEYNLDVMVQSNSLICTTIPAPCGPSVTVLTTESITLCQAVKMVGGAGRAEKMWRSYAVCDGTDKWERREMHRDSTQIRAKRQVSVNYAMDAARLAAKRASALRTAIQIGNATERETNLDPSLFE